MAGLALPSRAAAKGNDLWVLTGGDLGSYAMAGVDVDLVDTPAGWQQIAAPATPPSPRYDLYNSYGEFAVPTQMWSAGGAWVHYYPTADLLEFQGSDAQQVTHMWYRPSPDIAATLRQAVDAALAMKAAGQLPSSPIAADFHARSLDRAEYRVSPFTAGGATPSDAARAFYATDHGGFQISGADSAAFVMRALVDTVSQPPVPSQSIPAYEITFAADVGGGAGIGGSLGYYSPPQDGQPGHFWDEDYAYGGAIPYATTPDFDAIVMQALGLPPPPTAAPSAVTSRERSRSNALLAAAVAAISAVVVIGALTFAARHQRESRI
jgi:hypothetical protein